MFAHADLLHLLLNLMAFVPLGNALERTIGSVQMLHLVLLCGITAGLLHGGLAELTDAAFRTASSAHECIVGISGVIFALLVIYLLWTDPHERLSLFGLVAIPARLYPWALLIVFQLLLPSVSFLGHLSGLLVGYLCGPRRCRVRSRRAAA